jgi:ABC-type nitrate/sulfonate/bicarbonate transport system substrate-binding protein
VRARLFILASCLAALALAGCGASGAELQSQQDTLLLDFTPNAVHSGIYLAKERGYDRALGVDLTIRRPGASTDSLKLLESGRADAAILDIHDLGIAREHGADIVGVMALVQRPLAAVLAQPSIHSPRDLQGKPVGVTGLPSDDAVLRSVVHGAGGDPAKVHPVTIGFDAVKALLARRVAAATAFWDVEGVALRAKRPGIREFRVDDYGAPPYPELVLCVTRTTLQDRRAEVEAIIQALQRGYTEAQDDPDSAVQAIVSAEPDLDARSLSAQMSAVAPAFTEGVGSSYGKLVRPHLVAWAAWDRRFGILKRPIDVDRAFDFTLVHPFSPD